jgi:cysteine desulfurase/selenocysteine lyase
MLDFKKIIKAYPQPENTTYLNTSSSGLISKSGMEKTNKFHEELHKYGSGKVEQFIAEELQRIRKIVSDFMDVPIQELAFTPNFSYGLCAIIPALSTFKRVLLFEGDYPSLIQPFLINDFDIHWVDSNNGFTIDLGELKESILQNNIEILAISHVQYLSGFKIDIEEVGAFCKKHDVIFILDGTQSLGAVPFSFKNSEVNIYIASNYKWMNGGYGTGIICMKEETMHRFPPKVGGFGSFKLLDNDWKYSSSIHSYEPGHQNFPGLIMLQDAINFKNELGLDNIAKHNMTLLTKLTDGMRSNSLVLSGPGNNRNRSNIIGIKGDEHLDKYLREKGIIVNMRNDIIRIGIHFYNTEEDINRLIKVLNSY